MIEPTTYDSYGTSAFTVILQFFVDGGGGLALTGMAGMVRYGQVWQVWQVWPGMAHVWHFSCGVPSSFNGVDR